MNVAAKSRGVFFSYQRSAYNYTMTQARIFPFRRVSVDHMVRGVTRVWWQLEPLFNDPGPYSFQLQFGRTGLRDALDWQNVGSPVGNGYMATDPEWHESGYDILSHYRVVLTTPSSTYVSQPANCFGDLPEKDWLMAREIIRKEQVRHRLVSSSGYLLKPMRHGILCKRCRDPLTQEITDANCPVCSGTGFEIGFHPALPMQCWDLSPVTIDEEVDGNMRGATRENAYVQARVIGFPAINKDDIWVNGSSDERWRVDVIQVAAAIRNVPVVYQIKLGLLPFSNPAYALEIGGEPAVRTGPVLPMRGCGSVPIDQDYLGLDSLIYAPQDGCPVVGADIYVFNKTDFDDAGLQIARAAAVAKTTTRVNGRWTESLKVNPGEYVLLYEKLGEYGPDTYDLTVEPPTDEAMQVWSPPIAPVYEPPTQTTTTQIPTLRADRPKTTNQNAKNNFWDI